MSTKITINTNLDLFAYLVKNSNCLDIGANIGDYTKLMLDSGAKSIICFEPGKNCFNTLKELYNNNNRVTNIYNYGLSDIKTTLKNVTWLNAWVIGNPNELHLPVSPGACNIEGYELVDIELDTLDNIFYGNIDDYNFWKIDVDGYDFKVLKGGINLIKKNRPIIYIELSYYYDIIPGSSINDFFNFIIENNYIFFTADGNYASIEYIKQEFPYHSSCDVFLCPIEKKDIITNFK